MKTKESSKTTTKDPHEKVARQRLSVLQLADSLGCVSEACRQSGMDRTSFYAWKKRFDEQGLEGLKDLPPIPHGHPAMKDQETVQRVLDEAILNPAWGCIKLSDHLKLQGVDISSPTVQKILIRHNLASRHDRFMALEEKHLKEGIELNTDQIRAIEKINPCFAERHVESSKPGELLCQDTKLIGTLSGIGRIYLHAVIGTYGSFAFGFLHTSKQPDAAVAVLYNDVIPTYKDWGISIETILTDNGREYCGTEAHPYELFLQLSDIEHRKTKVRSPQTNGFVERFNRTIKEDCITTAYRKKIYTSIEE